MGLSVTNDTHQTPGPPLGAALAFWVIDGLVDLQGGRAGGAVCGK